MPRVTDPVLFPDATATLCTFLAAATGEATDYRVTPGYDGGKLLVVRRTGGQVRDVVIDQATMVVEAWDDSYEDAHDLAQLARAYLLAAWNTRIDDTVLYRVVELG